MIEVQCKSGKFRDLLGKNIKVYSIRNDNNGYPHFLIYYDNCWLWASAKYFKPSEVYDRTPFFIEEIYRKLKGIKY